MRCFIFLFGDFVNNRSKYISSALLLVITSICIKVIGAIYKIPLTAYIGAVGRGYFAAAYTVCLPVHALTMGCLPVALSRLVSKYNANSNKTAIVGLKFASSKLFCVVGFVGMCVVLIVAYPYSVFIADAPKSVYTIVALAPSVFFSCLAASYRGYYEGFQNMVPTSVSQFIEAVSKMILGIAFAKLSVLYMFSQYSQTGKIFSNAVLSDRQAFSVIYPYAAAAAAPPLPRMSACGHSPPISAMSDSANPIQSTLYPFHVSPCRTAQFTAPIRSAVGSIWSR